MKKLITILIVMSILTSCTNNPKNRENVIKIAIVQDMDSFDPHLSSSGVTNEVLFNIYEGLMKGDFNGKVVPALAKSYNISSDGLTYTFKLRDNIKFQNGELVTAEDVKYSLERVMGTYTQKPLTSVYKNVESVNIIDINTIELKLKNIDMSLINNITTAILPKANDNNHKKYPIGTGPYKLEKYSPEQYVRLTKNPYYWKENIPKTEKVEFKIIPDNEAAILALKAKNIDILPRLSNDRVKDLGRDFKSITAEQNLVQSLVFNNKKAPFKHVKVRQAINYAIDVKEIIKGVTHGFGTPVGSTMSPVMKKYYNNNLTYTYEKNISKARALMKEAGYEEGFKTTITIPSNYVLHVDCGQIIIQQLKKINIDAKLELVEWGVWLDRVYKNRDYDMTIIALTGKLDPYKIMQRYDTDYNKNFMNYTNKKYDELLKKANETIDEKQRILLYKDAQTILNKDAVAVFIMDPMLSVGMNKNIEGYKVYPIYVQDMANVYKKESNIDENTQ